MHMGEANFFVWKCITAFRCVLNFHQHLGDRKCYRFYRNGLHSKTLYRMTSKNWNPILLVWTAKTELFDTPTWKIPQTKWAPSCTQSPQAPWPAVGHQQRLWSTGIFLLQDFCDKTMDAVTELDQSSQSKQLNFLNSSEPLLAPTRWPKSLRTLGTR